MKNLILTLSTLLMFTSGCSMCCGPFDYDYPTFGGKHQRVNRSFGRVGSILSDPVVSIGGPSADSNLATPPEPMRGEMDDDDSVDILDSDYESGSGGQKGNGTEGAETEDSLESIEPLRTRNADDGDTTASTLWRPRPLR